jgi:hypothetical protein
VFLGPEHCRTTVLGGRRKGRGFRKEGSKKWTGPGVIGTEYGQETAGMKIGNPEAVRGEKSRKP